MALPQSLTESKQIHQERLNLITRPGTSGRPEVSMSTMLTMHELINNRTDDIPSLSEYSYKEARHLRDILIEGGMADEIKKAREKGREYDKYADVKARVFNKAKQHIENNIEYSKLTQKQKRFLQEMITNNIVGYGPIQPLWDATEVNEIMIDGPKYVKIEYMGQKTLVPNCVFADTQHLMDVCVAIVAPLNRSFDSKDPLTDAKLPDLSRVNMTHTSIAPEGPYVAIRKFRKDTWTMEKYIKAGAIDPEMARDLSHWVERGCSTIIIGGTSSGKTSVLNAMSGQIREGTRIIVIEDSRELKLPIHSLYEESRKANAQGVGEITLSDLVINALRQAPDRIVVGEARTGTAMMAVMKAMSTGHSGSISTVHANNADEGVERFITEIQTDMPAVNRETVLRTICGAVNIFVTVARFPEDGSRRITGIYEVPKGLQEDGSFKSIPLWEWETTEVLPRDKDGNRKVVGRWVKRNELSERLKTTYRIYDEDKPTLEQVNERSRGDWSNS